MKSNRRRSPVPSKKDNARAENGGGSSSSGTSFIKMAPIPRTDCSSNTHPSSSKTSPTLLATPSTQSLFKASEDRSHIYPTGSLGTPTGSSSAASFADELLNDDLIKVLFLWFFLILAFLLLVLK